nr:dipeptide/oligopeptide/nickel ABC transporter ATP-binding protein [Roseomonas marmotae]
MLLLREPRKSYRRGSAFRRQRPLPVLRGGELRIGPGECVALLGPTGSGKSTLGRALLGLDRLDAGEVLFEGQPLLDTRGRMAPATRRAIQAVFQDPHGATSPRFTAFEVVAEPLRYLGLSGDALRTRVEELVAAVGLDDAELGRLAHRFSGGQLQRLCIARALAPRPRLLVLDEAVNSLDLESQSRILRLLSALRAGTGLAYLFITHDLRLIRGFADRCYVMQDGQVVEVPEPFGNDPVPPAMAALRAAILPARPCIRRVEAPALA